MNSCGCSLPSLACRGEQMDNVITTFEFLMKSCTMDGWACSLPYYAMDGWACSLPYFACSDVSMQETG
jgi:hypothetical protein